MISSQYKSGTTFILQFLPRKNRQACNRNKTMSNINIGSEQQKQTVVMFQDDYDRMKSWVLSYPDRETGGQIFGLWTAERNAYASIIIGPGKNCRHETHSFFQDVEYLQRVGRYLNTEYMMCHIGEWHSHHRLRLRSPSSGDTRTIWKNFPAGVDYFLLIIATIENETVHLSPWLFSSSTHTYKLIDIETLEQDNVFLSEASVVRTIECGAEDFRQSPWYSTCWGTYFVQLLHSKLEKIIDQSTNIEMTSTKDGKVLQFTLRRKSCRVSLYFLPDFPGSDVLVTCQPPESLYPIEWSMRHEKGYNDGQDFVDEIIKQLQRRVPTPQ